MLVRKTPEMIKKFLQDNSHCLDLPELWIGCEPNTFGPWGKGKLFKDHDYFFDPINDHNVVRFCHMSCCDLVQIAGNQTVPLLNQICNMRDPRILAERGNFPPTRKDIKIFNEAGIPPFSLESKHTIFTEFDIIGTTLAFPGFWPNFVKQFRDAGAPPRWEDRDRDSELYPIVFCGGQIFAQPGPIYPIVDVVAVGEAEDGVSGSDGDPVGFPTLLLDVIEWKHSGDWYSKQGRLELLHKWARDHKWLWVPRFYEYNYYDPRETKRHFAGWTKKFDDIPDRARRRWIKNLDDAPPVLNPIINAHDPSMGCLNKQNAFIFVAGQGLVSLEDFTETQDIHKHVAVDSLTGVACCYLEQGVRSVYKIKNRFGIEASYTLDHRIRVWNQDGYVWKQVGALVKGDYVVIQYGMDCFGPQQIVDGVPINKEVAWLLGYLLGDGNLYEKPGIHRVRWIYSDQDVCDRIKLFYERNLSSFGCLVQETQNLSRSCWSMTVHSGRLMDWLLLLGIKPGKGKLESNVPVSILQSPREVQAAFLCGWWDADGHFDKHSNFLSTCKEHLAQQVAVMCLNLGSKVSIQSIEPHTKGVQVEWKVNILVSVDEPAWQKSYLTGYKSVGFEEWVTGDVRFSQADIIPYFKWIYVEHGLNLASTGGVAKVTLLNRWGILARFKFDCLQRKQYYSAFEGLESQGEKPTCDLSVEEIHHVIVNGVVAHNCGEVEASRSCSGHCAFCAESFRYAPYREHSVEYLLEAFKENIKMSGSTNAFPTGFDFPCYSRRCELYYRLATEVCSEVDTQSSRVDHFVDGSAWAKMAGQLGMRQLACGAEGNSERLRQIISKGAPEEKILEAVRFAIESKFDKIKFFMIADWEWETPTDTDEIIALGEKIVAMKKDYGSTITVRFSWTPLLLEAWTPLMWCRTVVEDKKLAGVYERLKPLGIAFTLGRKTERNYYYFMQAFHMADPLLADLMIRVAEQHDQVYCGAVDRKWVQAMEVEMAKEGLTWDHYFRAKNEDEEFWWDIIDIGISKQWFLDYYRKIRAIANATDPARVGHQPMHEELVQIGTAVGKADKTLRLQPSLLAKGQLVGNCDTVCSACMACEENGSGKVDFYKNVMFPQYWKANAKADAAWGFKPMHLVDDVSYNHKLRIQVRISPDKRFMPNEYWVASIRRAAYMSGIPIGKRAIRIASDVHGYRPWVAGVDYVELGIRYHGETLLSPGNVVANLNENAPVGLEFICGKYVPRDANIATAKDLMGLFRYELRNSVDEAMFKLRRLLEVPVFKMKREEYRKGITTVEMQMQDWLRDAWLTRDGHKLQLSMLLNYGEPTPYNIIAAVFNMSEADTRSMVCSLQDLFVKPSNTIDFFSPQCTGCGEPTPVSILGIPSSSTLCLRCSDMQSGIFIETEKR